MLEAGAVVVEAVGAVVVEVGEALVVVEEAHGTKNIPKIHHILVSWAHERDNDDNSAIKVPSWVKPKDRKLIKSYLVLWSVVNLHVQRNGPFKPLLLFKHASQSLYSKLKCGVDGLSQYRHVMNSPGVSLKWEQKLEPFLLSCPYEPDDVLTNFHVGRGTGTTPVCRKARSESWCNGPIHHDHNGDFIFERTRTCSEGTATPERFHKILQ